MIRLFSMFDTINQMNERQKHILAVLRRDAQPGPSEVRQLLAEQIAPNSLPALITIKRDLDELTEAGYCIREGKGRATGYRLSMRGLIMRPFDVDSYVELPPDERVLFPRFSFELFPHFPDRLLSDARIKSLDEATKLYQAQVAAASPVVLEKEMERFVIELSWKSSMIEGNTYTLLDTERLIKEGVPASGHHPAEAQMILNHKHALQFVAKTVSEKKLTTLNQRLVEQIHELLIKDMGVATGPRRTLVGITGSAYTPLDNEFQIREALTALYAAIDRLDHPIEKAMLALAGLSYIQPFEDGNKRTARLASNALLLAHNHAPLSYRNVDIESYRSAMLLFYEQNSIAAVKDIFIAQYEFSTTHYLVR